MTAAIEKVKLNEMYKLSGVLVQSIQNLKNNGGLYASKQPVYRELMAIIQMLKFSDSASKMQFFYPRMRKITYILSSTNPSNNSLFMRLCNIENLGQLCFLKQSPEVMQMIEEIAEKIAPVLQEIELDQGFYKKQRKVAVDRLVEDIWAMNASISNPMRRHHENLACFYERMVLDLLRKRSIN